LGHGVGILLASVRRRTIPGNNKVTSNHYPPIGCCWAASTAPVTCYIWTNLNRSSGSSPLQAIPSVCLLIALNVDVVWNLSFSMDEIEKENCRERQELGCSLMG